MNIGQNLLDLYKKLNERNVVKTKQEFCEKIGIKYKNFSKYLRNELKFEISENNYEKVLTLGINISWLFTGHGSMFYLTEDKNTNVNFNDLLEILNSIKTISPIDKQILLKYFSVKLNTEIRTKILELLESLE